MYERFGERDSIAVTVFLEGKYDGALTDAVTVVTDVGGELGAFWFVIFDGGGTGRHRCAVVAEERDPGQYYGFWTYDPVIVGDLVASLETTDDGP